MNIEDYKKDIHPRNWFSKFRQNSLMYFVKMGILYHLLSLVLGSITYSLQVGITGNEILFPPVSLSSLVFAGPIEESLAFGIPYYLSGNHYVIFVTGAIWASLHIFNSDVSSFGWENLSYYNLVAVIPIFSYSYRLWIVGKGWFSILAHSIWNLIVFVWWSLDEESISTELSIHNGAGSIWEFIVSIVLMGITFVVYRWRKRRNLRNKSPL